MDQQRCLRVLGLSGNASTEEIQQSYRRLAREHHPDKNNNNPEATRKFQEISNAYQTLTKQTGSSHDDDMGFPFGQRRFYADDDDDDDDDEQFTFFGPSMFAMFMQELMFERMVRNMFAQRHAYHQESHRSQGYQRWRHEDDLPFWARGGAASRDASQTRRDTRHSNYRHSESDERSSSATAGNSTQHEDQSATKPKGHSSGHSSSKHPASTKKSRRRLARREKRHQKSMAREKRRHQEDMESKMSGMKL